MIDTSSGEIRAFSFPVVVPVMQTSRAGRLRNSSSRYHQVEPQYQCPRADWQLSWVEVSSFRVQRCPDGDGDGSYVLLVRRRRMAAADFSRETG